MTEQHPGATPYKDRHGRTRWRYRRSGKTWSLPHSPGHPDFEAAYTAAVTGQPRAQADVRRMPGAAHPRSLRAAWRLVVASNEWRTLKPATRTQQTSYAEAFFAAPIAEGDPLRFGEMPIDRMERRHIKAIISRWSETPHAARHIFKLIRKLIGAALDEEWIKIDPSYRLKYRPEYGGWRAWTADERAAFESRWPIGSTPRLVYTLTLLTGARRGDVARIKWTDLDAGGIGLVPDKTGRPQWLPILDKLRAALDAAPRAGATILLTQQGRPFSQKALGMRMQVWTRAAGIEPGATMHGLRKTLGKLLAEHGATTRQIMAVLGHRSITQAELYTREAEQKQLASDGMATLKFNVIAGGKRPG